jgi:hypothetical protein
MTSIDPDLEIIANSLRMLPPWDWDDGEHSWWARYAELCGEATTGHRVEAYSRRYLGEKLSWVATARPEHGGPGCANQWEAHERAKYVLMFFDIDHPAMHAHLDAVTPTFDPLIPGTIGRRWAHTPCTAAWRVIVATEPANHYSHNFAVPDRWWREDN